MLVRAPVGLLAALVAVLCLVAARALQQLGATGVLLLPAVPAERGVAVGTPTPRAIIAVDLLVSVGLAEVAVLAVAASSGEVVVVDLVVDQQV